MKTIVLVVIFGLVLIGCGKEESNHHECYDSSLVHNGACFMDCPGFLGCNGETYCNECEAALEGIGPM